jgi:hypothetical protein
MEYIKRNLVLKMLAVRETPSGKPHIFSIKFCDKKGNVRFFPQAISCGAGRMNEWENRMRGIQPCCSKGNPDTAHPYPVSIDRLIEFNGARVIL